MLIKPVKMFASKKMNRPVIFESIFLTKLNELSKNWQQSTLIVVNFRLCVRYWWFSMPLILLRSFTMSQTIINLPKHIHAHKNVAVVILNKNHIYNSLVPKSRNNSWFRVGFRIFFNFMAKKGFCIRRAKAEKLI